MLGISCKIIGSKIIVFCELVYSIIKLIGTIGIINLLALYRNYSDEYIFSKFIYKLIFLLKFM